ncbi:MAG: alpha/beta hydrolase [Actinomycetia bacterium]|nr:alpha/beta hydrolase [Actinomycetes bacterium]
MAVLRSPHRRRVLFLPGYGAGDRSTAVLRTSISAAGHDVHRWRIGRNKGPTPEIIEGLEARFVELADRHATEITVVGWSLGGVYAWALAQRFPDRVQQVITLGSPLHSLPGGPGPLAVPATSIWSRNDRVVPWRASVVAGERVENIEVRASHLTLGFDPLVTHAIIDRLAQPPDRWRPFRAPRWLPHAYPGGSSATTSPDSP